MSYAMFNPVHCSGRCFKSCGIVYRSAHQLRADVKHSFIPTSKDKPKDIEIRSHELMYRAGFIRQQASGVYTLLPLALRSIAKLSNIIHEEMSAIGADHLSMPCLTPRELWLQSGRWDEAGPELMKLKDRRKKEFCLGPTHEEPVTQLVADYLNSAKQLPIRLYQIDRKFRDEIRPRYGLLRGREFLMKDMYTFDATVEAAQESYKLVTEAYMKVFNRLGLPYARVEADTGLIGGTLSHEYQILSPIGEDTLNFCERCNYCANVELENKEKCSIEGCNLRQSQGIEVGHTFYLGTKYSDAFQATFANEDGEIVPSEMGCFGLGITRILAAAAEVCNDSSGLCLPLSLAPYKVCIIVLNGSLGKKAKDQSEKMTNAACELYDSLQATSLAGDVIIDSSPRSNGVKLSEADLIGYPFTIIIGNRHESGSTDFEVKRRFDHKKFTMSVQELVDACSVLPNVSTGCKLK
eukprot:m.34348 g.34348  ORF g.34348 m.34348 type:complete len:465 (-) comp8712_c0_seq2:920-2314(-)